MKLMIWLRFLRLHTSCLTQGIVLLGYLLAGNGLNWGILPWLAFAILFHAVGFGHNNLCDYEADMKDVHKRHFPLITGQIGYMRASRIVYLSLAILVLYGLFLPLALGSRSPLPGLLLVIAVLNGLAYNFESKESLLAPLYITFCFPPLLLYSYCTYQALPSGTAWMAFLYTVLQQFYQIAVSGYMKDLKADRKNLAIALGSRIQGDGWFLPSSKFLVLAFIPKFLPAIWLLNLTGMAWALSMLAYLAGCWFVLHMIQPQTYDNAKTVRRAALIEIFTHFALILALLDQIGPSSAAFLIGYELAFYISLNRVLWGTIIRPRV